MRIWRSVGTAIIIILCVVIESTWLSMIALPGAIPPLTLVAIFAYAQRRTPINAALLGFFAGIVIDVMPPSTTPIGITAFSFTLIGFFASVLQPYFEGSVTSPLLGSAAAALVSLITRVVISVATGSEINVSNGFLVALLTAPLYAAMLMSVVGPVTHFVDRLIAPRPQQTLFR